MSVVLSRVIGIGQPAAGDDGVGIAVIHQLRRTRLPADVELAAVGDAASLIGLLEGAGRVVLVDAVVGGIPGRVLRLAPEALEASPLQPLSTHGMQVTQAVDLARTLCPESAWPQVQIVGVCIEPPEPYTEGLSPEVAAAVPHAVREIVQLVGG